MTSSPVSPMRDRVAGRVDHGELPAGQRQPDPHRALAGQPRGAGDHGRLGRPVRVPDLAALDGQALGQLRRAGLAAEDQQPDVLERLDRPQRGQGRHGRHHVMRCSASHGPEVDAAAHQRPRGRHQAGAVPPGQPHLLAGGVEGHGQPGQHPVVRAERLARLAARNSRASASTNAAAARWLTATPFGVPVEPEVKMIQASSSGSGPARSARGAYRAATRSARRRGPRRRPPRRRPARRAPRGRRRRPARRPRRPRARRGSPGTARRCRRRPGRRPGRRRRCRARRASPARPSTSLGQLAVGQRRGAVVDRGAPGCARTVVVEDVGERAADGARGWSGTPPGRTGCGRPSDQ